MLKNFFQKIPRLLTGRGVVRTLGWSGAALALAGVTQIAHAEAPSGSFNESPSKNRQFQQHLVPIVDESGQLLATAVLLEGTGAFYLTNNTVLAKLAAKNSKIFVRDPRNPEKKIEITNFNIKEDENLVLFDDPTQSGQEQQLPFLQIAHPEPFLDVLSVTFDSKLDFNAEKSIVCGQQRVDSEAPMQTVKLCAGHPNDRQMAPAFLPQGFAGFVFPNGKKLVPASHILHLRDRLASQNSFSRPYIGLSLKQIVTTSQAKGLMVIAFNNDSPAQLAGIKIGDTITHVNGQRVQSLPEFLQSVGYGLNQELQVILERANKPRQVTLKL